jgi:hypothetical protein
VLHCEQIVADDTFDKFKAVSTHLYVDDAAEKSVCRRIGRWHSSKGRRFQRSRRPALGPSATVFGSFDG